MKSPTKIQSAVAGLADRIDKLPPNDSTRPTCEHLLATLDWVNDEPVFDPENAVAKYVHEYLEQATRRGRQLAC